MTDKVVGLLNFTMFLKKIGLNMIFHAKDILGCCANSANALLDKDFYNAGL